LLATWQEGQLITTWGDWVGEPRGGRPLVGVLRRCASLCLLRWPDL